MNQDEIARASKEDLLQWFANASKTAAQALGHTKTAMNDQAAARYKNELHKRGEQVERNEEVYAKGLFNGPGSV